MKFLMSLGPNCEDASVKTTSVIEKTVPATPIIALEMVDNILRAESELSTKKKRIQPSLEIVIELSKYTSEKANRTEKLIISTGRNQKVAPNSFQKKSIFFMLKIKSYTNVNITI